MSSGKPCLWRVAWLVSASAALLLLAAPVASAGAPDLGTRPPPRPDPLAEALEEQRSAAQARRAERRELREDWLDWQRDRGSNYREFLRERQEAERKARERERAEGLERFRPEPGGESLSERLEAQRQESFERLEQRTPAQRLRPKTLGRNRPGLRN